MFKIALLFLTPLFLFAGTTSVKRGAVFFSNKVVSNTSTPSQLQYYEFKSNLPNEISLDVLKDKDMSAFKGKHIFVGYGVVDPTGTDCKVFDTKLTGLDNNITVCLPWWRIEREYEIPPAVKSGTTSFSSFIAKMQRPKVGRNVNVCNSWESSESLPGGTVTCTSYYDRTLSKECYDNPKQAKCFKNNCGNWVINNCVSLGRSIGYKNESLKNVSTKGGTYARYESKVDLVTRQFSCPGGSFTNRDHCLNEETVVMYPFECKANNPSDTSLDNSIMVYCDDNKPVRDVASGAITGFLGTCPGEAYADGIAKNVTCTVNSFKHTTSTCIDRAPDTNKTTDEVLNEKYKLDYTVETVNVLSGSVDRFSSRDNCVRANTIDAGRDNSINIHVAGSGRLDDDIYVILHHADNTHTVAYCNQQHNKDYGSKLTFNEISETPIQCIPNSGNYAFDQHYNIKNSDILSIQQSTEDEEGHHTFFSADSPQYFYAREGYISSKVIMDETEVVPEVYGSDFPYYSSSPWINIWDNALGSLGLMFPYAGSYTLYFYNMNNELETQRTIGLADFESIGSRGYKQIFLARDIPINPLLNADNNTTLCLDDDWVDYGGGMVNGKRSRTGETCQTTPAGNTYVRQHAIKRVVVKDLLTGSFTIIPLVYPLGYPNRVFISKLKLYERRIYHCYKPTSIKAPY